ncbi:cadherin-23-like [Biomphalaria glabrata]|uniref:Cadherin-23-like n=1 Tax=Biomphalaria glabrata TaxID=6526 RepID=A0A9U8E0Z3_BIOGL|nr:cadherin-23-like [Biomphalaria glabrata]XP_013068653.2 cadherin-23-like [Biomphalaria glabrata]XP_013068654.2 cadherin-23-like [Biomphalaria glabrata]XP_013068655.2 cadherin-23-like [Biomphalaria glabrata]XP_013068656.2 cadherin-23-like [Biomphalaria glabrata]XP_013068657.2 cadherin-23-like [Biomphalaria glabrata]XP_013068659.2 cadherin-23-like [Biomphalaria glabrata]XP_013068660.2 cadherin-23-like [Biomphalaria glabrata]XP_013068661.2 cadherin-23-like [Biomphalaria glabrata]XP_01306866
MTMFRIYSFLFLAAPVTVLFMPAGISSSMCSDDLSAISVPSTIEEHTMAGTLIRNITTSNDLELDQMPYFEVVNGSLFTTINFTVDGEQNQKLCQEVSTTTFVAQLKCKGEPSMATMIIIFQAKDDFDPVLPQTFVQGINVTERTPRNTVVLDFKNSIYAATDEDCLVSEMIYSISDSSKMFVIKSNSLLTLIGDLDYETLPETPSNGAKQIYVNITVTSVPNSGQGTIYRSTWKLLTINVMDVDDEKPIFDSTDFQLHANESTDLSTQWLKSSPRLNAQDGDKGINTTINYSITNIAPQDLQIEINNSTGDVRILSVLDRNKISEYIITVTAFQVDNPSMSSNATLKIIVDDVNDHRPEFITPTNEIHMNEDAPNGYYVLPLSARDLDQGDNALVRYVIQSDDTSAFSIKYENTTSTSWLIVGNSTALRGKEIAHIKVELREVTPAYGKLCDYITTCLASITVYIDDVNDHSPEFSQSLYEFNVQEGSQPNTVIGKISASDADKGDNAKLGYSYFLISSTFNCKQLMVDNISGEIIMKIPILSESVCYLTVTACDSPENIALKKCSTVPVTVVIKSSGTNSTIIPDYNVSVSENVPVNTPVTVLPFTGLTTNSTDFNIQADVLYTSKLLDREAQDNYNVFFFSGALQSSVFFKMTVIIEDVNDNAPKFSNDVYYLLLKENATIGQVLLQINATDADLKQNAELKYSLLSGREFLSIDEKMGQIKLTNIPVDKEINGTGYTILVTDSGLPPLQSTAILKVYIPRFNETAYVDLPVDKDKLMADRENVGQKLESCLGVKVKILNIESLSEISIMGSRVYITASTLQGKQLDATGLNSLIKANAEKIYSQFKNADESTSNAYLGPFIAVLVLAVLFLIITIVMSICLRKKQKRLKRQKQLFEKLNKDTSIYDSTRTHTESRTELMHNNSNHEYANNHRDTSLPQLDVAFENPTFVPDTEDAPHASESATNTNIPDNISASSHGSDEHDGTTGQTTRVSTPPLISSNINGTLSDSSSLKDSPDAGQKRTLSRGPSETDSGVPGIGGNFDEIDSDEADKEVADILTQNLDDTYAHVKKTAKLPITNSPTLSTTSDTKLDTSYVDIYEPEPDYAKKVHFHEEPKKSNSKRGSIDSNKDRLDEEIIISNSAIEEEFYFGDTEITAL